jgi:drug/metabolite transporter (DMT)-like permease
MIAPALLMWGLVNMPAAGASLLLNAEGVLTALIAWLVFRENFDRRIAIGMVLIVAGAVIAVVGLGEPMTAELLIAGALMAAGVWLHLTETHEYTHEHVALEHEHHHEHDAHHQHAHDAPIAAGMAHSHLHQHAPMTHSHAHFPDAYHQHHEKL